LIKKTKAKLITGVVVFILLAMLLPISTTGESSGVWTWTNPIYIEEGEKNMKIESPYNGTYDYRHKVQLHTHTTNSDGSFRPSEIMSFHEDEGYLAVAITDHDCERWDASLEDPRDHDIIHIPGVEYTTGYHMLGIGINSIAHENENKRQEQIDRANHEEGMTFWAHPSTVEPIPYSVYEEYENWDGIEIFTSNAYSLAEDHVDYILTETEKRPLLIASSDTHQRVQEGGWIEILSDKPAGEMNYSNVMTAIKKGEFFAVGGWPHVHSDPAVLDINIEDDNIRVETDKKVDIEFVTNRKNHYLDGDNYVSVERSTTSASYAIDENDTYVRIKAILYRDALTILYTSMPIVVMVPTLFIMILPKSVEDKIFVFYQKLHR